MRLGSPVALEPRRPLCPRGWLFSGQWWMRKHTGPLASCPWTLQSLADRPGPGHTSVSLSPHPKQGLTAWDDIGHDVKQAPKKSLTRGYTGVAKAGGVKKKTLPHGNLPP